MDMPRVLLVAESAKGVSFLLRQLEKRGCECHVATSSSEATRLSRPRAFDLVLCTDRMSRIEEFIESLNGSCSTLFCAHVVEDGCWWFPVILHGTKCLGASALRPAEFTQAIDGILEEAKASRSFREVVAG